MYKVVLKRKNNNAAIEGCIKPLARTKRTGVSRGDCARKVRARHARAWIQKAKATRGRGDEAKGLRSVAWGWNVDAQ